MEITPIIKKNDMNVLNYGFLNFYSIYDEFSKFYNSIFFLVL
jgi:hypothetical protein